MKTKHISSILLLVVWIGIMPNSLYAQNTTNVTQLIRESQKALSEEKFDEAENLSQRAIALDPAHPPAWRQYGIALWRGGKLEEAITALRRSVEMDAKDTTAWRGLAMACWQSDKHKEALSALSSYLRLNPEDATAWRDLATWLTKVERPDNAVSVLKRVVGLDTENISAWRDLATGLSHQKRYEQAVIALLQVLKVNPNDASAWRDLATGLTHLKQYERAARALVKVIKINPDDASVWRELALLHQRSGDLADATKAFKQALSVEPAHAATQRDLGWILWKQGDRKGALAHLTKAVENDVDSRDDVVLQVVARLSEGGAYDEAMKFMHRVEPNKPSSTIALELARSGRLMAAEPILEDAWKGGQKTVDIGVSLAYARAVNGKYADISTYLDPLLQSTTPCSADHAEMAIETLRLSSSLLEIPTLTDRLEARLKNSKGYSKQITSLLEASADAQRLHSDSAQALHLYRRVLDRDPNRVSWIWVVLLTERIEKEVPFEWLDIHEARVSEPALLAGIRGVRANRRGDMQKAAGFLQRSLALNPTQYVLRLIYFQSLLSLGREEEARAEKEWFAKQIAGGETKLRPYLAEILTRLRDTKEALSLWKLLHQSSPKSTYYGIERASLLFDINRPDEAMTLLKKMAETTPNKRVFEVMAEMASARAESAEAAELATRGLAMTPSQTLLRLHAESLEQLQTNAPAALASAQQFLEKDPGYVPMTLLAGRMMDAMGSTNEFQEFHRTQLARNPVFLPSLQAMRASTTHSYMLKEATEYSRLGFGIQPKSFHAMQDYANSLSHLEKFRASLNLMRPLVKMKPENVLSLLVYQSPVGPPYAGRNSVAQIICHIKELSDAGYIFINAFSQMTSTPDARHIMLILIDPQPDVIESLDPVLKQYNARAVYAGNAAFPALTLSGNPIPKQLSPVLASGRWQLASGGLPGSRRKSVNAAGVLGNPMTHPLVTDKDSESPERFSSRLNKELSRASAALKEEEERILVYPSGDFGQRSLDTLPSNLKVLYSAVSNNFTHAICFDSYGFHFISPTSDPLRVPARVVPPGWDEKDLMTYLTINHPLTRGWLELGRELLWDGQHKLAFKAFDQAEKAGADPLELAFNRGVNAYMQGDLYSAHKRLQTALMLDPESTRNKRARERLDKRRRPQASLYVYGWDDNEGRDYLRYGAYGDMFVNERIRLGALADRSRWQTEGIGIEDGTRLGVNGLAFLKPQIWLSGSVWQLNMDDIDNIWGGNAKLRLPSLFLSGHLVLGVSKDEIETVEALQENITSETYSLRTDTRLFDQFDLFADLLQINRSDGNDTLMLNGRLLYRVHDWPYTGVGWRFRVGDSDFDPLEYWAPEELQQHQANIILRGEWWRLRGAVSAEAGYARDLDTDWRFVWGVNGNGTLTLTKRFNLFASFGWAESPTYERLQGRFGITGRL